MNDETLAKQIEGLLLAWREDLSGRVAEDVSIVIASHFQPVTAEEVVERIAEASWEYNRIGRPHRVAWANVDELVKSETRQDARMFLEALGPAYVVKEDL
jgi:hypothetical protein